LGRKKKAVKPFSPNSWNGAPKKPREHTQSTRKEKGRKKEIKGKRETCFGEGKTATGETQSPDARLMGEKKKGESRNERRKGRSVQISTCP